MVALIVLVVASGIFVPILLRGDTGGGFVLPGQVGPGGQSGGGGPEDGPGGYVDTIAMELNTGNVKNIIARLKRPEHYTISLLCENYSPVDALRQIGSIATDGRRTLVRLTGVSMLTGTAYLIEGDTVTIKDIETGEKYTAALGGFSPDDLAMIPTYEDILLIDDSAVIEAGIDHSLGMPCIKVVAEDAGIGYIETYYISIEWGLLVKRETQAGGAVIYRATLESLSAGLPGDETFVI